MTMQIRNVSFIKKPVLPSTSDKDFLHLSALENILLKKSIGQHQLNITSPGREREREKERERERENEVERERMK